MNSYGRAFSNIPPVTKNLIIINVIMLLATETSQRVFNFNLIGLLGLHFPASELFRPYQIVTHMFMHGGMPHLFFNMFALFMFGRVLESAWGPKRFFIYFIVTGLGAALIHEAVIAFEYFQVINSMAPDAIEMVQSRGYEAWASGQNFTNPLAGKLNALLNTSTVGASGAVFGVLLAFGMLFPNTPLYIMFIPVPIKAKYLVIGYGALELYLAIAQPGSSIAHAAHLGGMLFGYILIKYWRKTTKTLY